MVRRGYFDHGPFVQRLRRFGVRAPYVGENLASGTRPLSAAAIEELGAEDLVIFGVDAPRISSETLARAEEEELDEGSLLADDRRCLVVARVDARHAVGAGEHGARVLEQDLAGQFPGTEVLIHIDPRGHVDEPGNPLVESDEFAKLKKDTR